MTHGLDSFFSYHEFTYIGLDTRLNQSQLPNCMTKHQIAKSLCLKLFRNGSFLCPRCGRNDFYISSRGYFKCHCGLQGRGWIELVSKIYLVSRESAQAWLAKRKAVIK
jgi:hypothetical protein